jgi:ParB family chromosome partitioning protein
MAKEKIALTGFADIFGSAKPQDGESVQTIALTELHAPDLHPFRVNDDDAMTRLVESVKRFGVREPGLARVRDEGGYELLCGNRRKRACELAGLAEMPIIVRELDDDSAVISMIDSNIQSRERILPSERAWAYKMKMDALNHNGVKADRHSCDVMAEQTGESVAQLFRYIRLTELIEVLLDKVDANQLALMPAVQISYLTYDEQRVVADCMERHDMKPSNSQAVRLKKLKQAGTLTLELINGILAEEKKPPKSEPIGSMRFRKFFPPDYSSKQIESVIIGLLTDWKKAGAAIL